MNKTHWQDWAIAIVAAWLFVTPWILGMETATIAWNFWIVGAAIAILALFETTAFDKVVEWAIAALGTWMLLAPRIMDFQSEALTWSAAISGAIVVAFSAWAIGDAHEILPKSKRAKDDLRGDMQGIAVPDEHEHMAGATIRRPDAGPGLVSPGVGTQSPGQTSHE